MYRRRKDLASNLFESPSGSRANGRTRTMRPNNNVSTFLAG